MSTFKELAGQMKAPGTVPGSGNGHSFRELAETMTPQKEEPVRQTPAVRRGQPVGGDTARAGNNAALMDAGLRGLHAAATAMKAPSVSDAAQMVAETSAEKKRLQGLLSNSYSGARAGGPTTTREQREQWQADLDAAAETLRQRRRLYRELSATEQAEQAQRRAAAEYLRLAGLDIGKTEAELEAVRRRSVQAADLDTMEKLSAVPGGVIGHLAAKQAENREYQREIDALESDIEGANRIRTGWEYQANTLAPDFAGNSRYRAGKVDDPDYNYINRDPAAIQAKRDAMFTGNGIVVDIPNQYVEQMNDEQIALFNYLYHTKGKDAAYQYIKYLEPELNAMQRQKETAQWQAQAEAHPVGMSAVSVAMAPTKGISYMGQAVDYLADGKIDQNAAYNRYSYLSSGVRETVSALAEDRWGKKGSFLYQTGMSMGDFLMTTLVSGGFSGAGGSAAQRLALSIMGSGAAADATIAAKDRGLSDHQAFALGTIAGAAEIITEKVSLETLLDQTALSKSAMGYFLKNVLAEGSEEVGSDFINLFADVLIARDKSEWRQTIDQYKAQGMDEKTAFWHAVTDQAQAMGLDFLGGALSGGVMAGGGIVVNQLAGSRQNTPVFEGVEAETGGLIPYSHQETNNFLTGARNKVLSTFREIADFAKNAVSEGQSNSRGYMGKIPESTAKMVLAETGIDINGYNAVLSSDSVRHIIKHHGDVLTERARGQVNVTAEDIALIPQILSTPDAVERSTRKDARGRTALIFSKRIGNQYVSVQAVSDGTHSLQTDTLFIQKIGEPTDTVSDIDRTADPALYAQSVPPSGSPSKSIPQIGGKSKQILSEADRAVFGAEGQKVADTVVEYAMNRGLKRWEAFVAFSQAYHQGETGQKMTAVDGLDGDSLRTAYTAGKNDAAAALAREKQEAQFASVAGEDAGLVMDDYVKETMGAGEYDVLNETAKRLGLRVRFVDELAHGANADINGAEVRIQKDNPNPVRFLLGHEITHRLQELAPEAYRKFRDLVMQGESGRVLAYQYIYREQGVSLDYEAAMDEVAADYAGRLMSDGQLLERFIAENKHNRTLLERLRDAFHALVEKLTGREREQARTAEQALTRALNEAEKQAKKNAGENKTAAQEGDGARYSIEKLPDGKQFVRADRQVIFGNDPVSWGQQVENYINGKIRRGQDVQLLTEDGDILTLTSVTAGKARHAYKPDGTRMTDDEYLTKVNAETHIDELAQISTRGTTKPDVEGRHGEFASSGWNYRTAYFQDFDGKYYRVRISVAQSQSGNVVYNIGDIQERSFPTFDGSSAKGGALSDEKASTDSIPEAGGKSKSRFSLNAPVEETKDLLAIHNLGPENLIRALDLGGMPMPSIAVVKAEAGHSNYGPISLVFDKSTIDPEADKRNKVYGGDGWTPTAPRVEYEVDYPKRRDIENRIEELSGRIAGGMFQKNSVIGMMGLDTVSTMNEEKLAEKLAGEDAVKAAYLAERGEMLEPVTREKVKQYDSFGNEALENLIKRMGTDQTLAQLSVKAKTGETFTDSEIYDIKQAIGESMKKKSGPFNTPEKIQRRLDKLTPERMAAFVRNAWSLREGGTSSERETDYYATKDALRAAASDEEVMEWILPQLKGLLGEPGIYNGKERYTPAGNQREFGQLHYAYTLENIVKAMTDTQQERGEGAWGISAGTLQATAATDYQSIHDLKADSGRLARMTDAEYKAAIETVDRKIGEVIMKVKSENEAHSDNSFIESDIIGTVMMDAARGRHIESAVIRAFRKEGYEISTQTAKDILALYREAAELPTEYFEAKPQRAVGFDEVIAAVVPDDISADVREAAERAGLTLVEYRSGDETDRLKKVNSVENARFSLTGAREFADAVLEVQQNREGKTDAEVRKEIIRLTEEFRGKLIDKHGEIPAGERPAREAHVPKKTSEREKVSWTVRTVLEAKATPETMVPDIERLVAEGKFSYESYSDKQAIRDAENVIDGPNGLGWDKAQRKWFDDAKKGTVSKEHTALGWVLYNNAANKGNTQLAMDILQEMVRTQRLAAQALQASRILKTLTPEAQLYNAQRSVANLQEELAKKYKDKAPTLKLNEELAADFLQAETQEARDEAMNALFRDIGHQMPSTFMDKWNAWRYLAMLGNPRTHMRNFFGNAGFVPVVAVKNTIATGLETAVDKVTKGKAFSGDRGTRTKSLTAGKDLYKAAFEDYKQVAGQVMEGGKYQDFAQNQAIEEGRVIFKSKLMKPVELARRGNSAALEREDAWFSKPHYAAALASYCKANGITADQVRSGKGIDRAREYAIREAQKATYRDTNALSKKISELGRYSGDDPVGKAGKILLEGILPFRKTPANILVRGVEYSPIGLLKSLSYDLVQVSKGNMSTAEMLDGLSAGLTGTGLLALGFWMAGLGLARGAGAGDDDKKKEFDKLMGHQDYALELPDGTSITLDWLAPEALPFFVGVNLNEQLSAKNDGESLSMADWLSAIKNVSEPMLEMSCLQSLNDLFDSVGYASQNGGAVPSVIASAATSYLTQALPTIFGQAERSGESKRMTTYPEESSWLTRDLQYTLGKASSRIPGIDFNQVPYIDAWGREELTGKPAERVVNNFLNPAYLSKIDESAMEQELLRLYEQTGDSSVFPKRAGRKITVDGESKTLSGEEYVKYATEQGQLAYGMVAKLTESKAYQSMNDEDRAKCVSLVYEYANSSAKTKVSDYIPSGWTKKAMETVRQTGVSPADYICAYQQQLGIESLKDAEGETIPTSEGLLKMEAIYGVSGLTDAQRAALFADFGVPKSVRHYNRAAVEEHLNRWR